MEVTYTINDRFKELRLALDLSQEQLGAPIGLTKSSVSNIEKGIRNLNDRIIMLLESKFNANPQWIRTGTGNMFLDHGDEFDDVARELNLNEFQRHLVQLIYEMPIEHQRIFRDYAVKLAEYDAGLIETEHERVERVANNYLDEHDAQPPGQQTDNQA